MFIRYRVRSYQPFASRSLGCDFNPMVICPACVFCPPNLPRTTSHAHSSLLSSLQPVYDDLRSLVDAYNREVAAKQQAGTTTTDDTPVRLPDMTSRCACCKVRLLHLGTSFGVGFSPEVSGGQIMRICL